MVVQRLQLRDVQMGTGPNDRAYTRSSRCPPLVTITKSHPPRQPEGQWRGTGFKRRAVVWTTYRDFDILGHRRDEGEQDEFGLLVGNFFFSPPFFFLYTHLTFFVLLLDTILWRWKTGITTDGVNEGERGANDELSFGPRSFSFSFFYFSHITIF